MRSRILIARLTSMLIGITSFLLILTSSIDLYEALQVKNWLHINGILNEAKIVSYHHIRTGRVFQIQLQYTYELEGVYYVGKQLRIGAYTAPDENKARRIIDELQKSDPLIVYVDPKKHSRSVLMNNVDLQNFGSVILWVVIAIFCGIAWLRIRKLE